VRLMIIKGEVSASDVYCYNIVCIVMEDWRRNRYPKYHVCRGDRLSILLCAERDSHQKINISSPPHHHHRQVLQYTMNSCTLQLLISVIFILCCTSESRRSRGITFSSPKMDRSDSGLDQLGGGSINEKQRTFQQCSKDNRASITHVDEAWDPRKNLSHLLHAFVGLNRYPNYMSRYNEYDITAIEHALEQTLNDVRQQRVEILQRRNGIRELVQKYNALTNPDSIHEEEKTSSDSNNVLHISTLSPPRTWSELKNVLSEEAFDVAYRSIISSSKSKNQEAPTPQHIINGKFSVHLDPALLDVWMSQECFDVFSFRLLNKDFCSIVRRTITDLSKLGESSEFCSLLLGRRPIDFDTVGLSWISDMLFHMFIQPISRHLYATTERLLSDEDACNNTNNKMEDILNWRQGYIAGYAANPQEGKAATRHRLVPHSDDSEVTLNCCLGEEDFEGGKVQFYGLRGTQDEGKLLGEIERPDVGTAVIHAGRHLHAVSDVTAGNRYALIVWTRSWGMRRHTCPCCYLNRRIDSSCICDVRWN